MIRPRTLVALLALAAVLLLVVIGAAHVGLDGTDGHSHCTVCLVAAAPTLLTLDAPTARIHLPDRAAPTSAAAESAPRRFDLSAHPAPRGPPILA